MSKDQVEAASKQMLDIASELGISTSWDRFLDQQPACKFGTTGVCCTNCNMGPCRIITTSKGTKIGACGADADIIVARNLARAAAAGSACHSDHGRELVHILLTAAKGGTAGYKIKDEEKLKRISEEFGVEIQGQAKEKIAEMLGQKLLLEFGKQEGTLNFLKRAPQKQRDVWEKLKIMPRSIDREVVETMARTHEGVDNDYKNIITSAMRASLADGWGGSMIATEVSDILFGSPEAVKSEVNLGVLKEDRVNVLVHGHQPALSDLLAELSFSPEITAKAEKAGAKGVQLAGICCTANEILMRKGIPVAGSFLQQELAILTGAVDAMVVDVQCVMPGITEIASKFHTKMISTSSKGRFINMLHIEFDENDAVNIAKKILDTAIEAFKSRDKSKINIPKEKMDIVAGFTTENIFYHLGGRYRPSYKPLNENIINGRIRGVAGVVGCSNPKNGSGSSHTKMVIELIKNDVLVVETGCAAIECAKAGLLTPEAALKYAGKGLQEVCKAVGIPPVLHNGSCVDNSRILIECCEMVKEGGIGASIDELPVAGAAPEWMSEKAIAIGWYVVASGLLVVFGTPLRVLGSENTVNYISGDMEKITGGRWAFESDPVKAAHIMIDHINKKREALKLKPMMYK